MRERERERERDREEDEENEEDEVTRRKGGGKEQKGTTFNCKLCIVQERTFARSSRSLSTAVPIQLCSWHKTAERLELSGG